MTSDIVYWGFWLLVSWSVFHRYNYIRYPAQNWWMSRRTLFFLVVFFLLWSVSAAAQPTPLLSPYIDTRVSVVSARGAVVMDADTGDVLWGQQADIPFAVASVTKVMTALVVMESDLPLDHPVRILASDVRHASTTYIRAKDTVTVQTLLFLMLVGSDNAAARALARETAGTRAAFVCKMNATAVSMGLVRSHFVDPAGLLSGNIMSGRDAGRLLISAEAHSQSFLHRVFNTQQFSTKIGTRTVVVSNTNRYLDDGVAASKTGFTSAAKYCLSILFETLNQKRYAVVVLGATTSAERFSIAAMFRTMLSK